MKNHDLFDMETDGETYMGTKTITHMVTLNQTDWKMINFVENFYFDKVMAEVKYRFYREPLYNVMEYLREKIAEWTFYKDGGYRPLPPEAFELIRTRLTELTNELIDGSLHAVGWSMGSIVEDVEDFDEDLEEF